MAPVEGVKNQWDLYFKSVDGEIEVQFQSYWDLSREVAEQHCKTSVPGHAQEYETAFALALFPENVRRDAMLDQDDREPLRASAEQGRLMAEAAVDKTAEFVRRMIKG